MKQEGSAYMIALLTMAGMSMLGATLLTLAHQASTLSRNHVDLEKAFALADGCIETAERTLVNEWGASTRTLTYGDGSCEFEVTIDGDKAVVTTRGNVKQNQRLLAAQFSQYPATPEGLTILGPTEIGFNGNAFSVYQITTDSATNTDAVGDALGAEQEDNVGTIVQDDSIATGDVYEAARSIASRASYTLEGSVSQETIGSRTSPVIATTRGEVNIQGPVKGYGILVAFEPISLRGRLEWHGLIIALGGMQVAGEGGQAKVYGSLMVTNTVTLGGNSSIQPSDIGDINQLIGINREWWRDNG